MGDDVYVKNDKSKYRGRERYKVVKIFEKTGEMWAIIQKINDKFMAKEYEVKLAEIFSAGELESTSAEYQLLEQMNRSLCHEL